MYHFEPEKYLYFTGNSAKVFLKVIHSCFSLSHQCFHCTHQGKAKKMTSMEKEGEREEKQERWEGGEGGGFL